MTLLRPLALAVALLFVSIAAHSQEICTNSIDDDADGLVDLNDTTDCACGQVPVPLDGILLNPSFEEFDCQPITFSQVDCASEWYQATASTSDYFFNPTYMPGWIPQPLPGGGSGCMGGYFCHDYMEYIGTCLLSPLEAGTSYSLSMSVAAFEIDNFLSTTTAMDLSPLNVTIYGIASCPSFPTAISLCPGTQGWTALGYATYTPGSPWTSITMTLTPSFDVQAIMIGAPCTLPGDYPNVFDPWLAYFIFDDLSLSTSGTIGATISSEGNWCDGDLVLFATSDSSMTGYQWYQNGIAIPGATDTMLAVSTLGLDAGDYMLRTVGDTTCAISLFTVGMVIEPTPYIALTADGLWCPLEGSYQWFLDGEPIAGAIDDEYLPLENGVYTVELTNAQGCASMSFPFNWLSTGAATSDGMGPMLTFSAEEAVLRVKGNPAPTSLLVFDASGRLVYSNSVTTSDRVVDLGTLSHGPYIARLGAQRLRFLR
jgi:hypothetical protein